MTEGNKTISDGVYFSQEHLCMLYNLHLPRKFWHKCLNKHRSQCRHKGSLAKFPLLFCVNNPLRFHLRLFSALPVAPAFRLSHLHLPSSYDFLSFYFDAIINSRKWEGTGKNACEPHHEKTLFCHMRTTKAQISLCIRAVWSAPLLFASWIVQYH